MWMSIFIYSNKYYNNINHVLLILSQSLFIMLIFVLVFFEPLNGEWKEVLQFNQRLWLVNSAGMEVNPNPLGVICAICAFGFFLNKKNLFMIFPLMLLLLTQSRAAMLFFLILCLLTIGITLKRLLITSLTFLPFFYIILNSNISNRFSEAGENGRLERMYIYLAYIQNNYLLGLPSHLYDEIVLLHGSLDNMYLLSVLRYGILGCLFLIFLVFIFIKNFHLDRFSKTRVAIIVAVFVLGIAESSLIANNYLMWLFFSLCLRFSNSEKGYA